ncbi:MAG: hypothetical protein QM726_17555 [Chitinophagaceae bacterium]
MENLPFYIYLVFVLATGFTIFTFYKASHSSKKIIAIIFLWLIVQSILSLKGFYTVTNAFPPRLIFLLAPPLIAIAILFLSKKGRFFLDNLNPAYLTILHTVRIFVELVLYWLFLYKAVPKIMTFEGRNLDIIAGLTAPVIYYFAFIRKNISTKILLAWHFVCVALLFNIVSIAILSAPLSFQRFGFEQPNIAILYFPFVWLPGFIVPVVLLSHLAVIKQLLQVDKKSITNNSPAQTNS